MATEIYIGKSGAEVYAYAIGQIESIVGMVGPSPLPATVLAVSDLRDRAEKAEARATRLDDLLLALTEAESDMQRDHILGEYKRIRAAALDGEGASDGE